ncbi:3'-5' exonuclease, partial [Neisseria elongata]|uniref:3'-5' exonuclease n=1 Tax=Neisseria elongata TaxID=495 RepID=UPI0036094826
QRQGIYAALTAFARRYGLEGRLLAADGGRTLTNFWQLAELLADENENSHTPAALHQWLLAKIQDPPQNENAVLRLESDEALVKIVTIHASKGLQYPFVFCPFSWDTAEKKNEAWHILHRENGSELLADSQLDEADREQLDDEDLGERLRLLYVALTRAEEQLVIYAARCSSTPRNTFAYLLEGLPSDGRLKTRQAYEAEKENQTEMLRRNWLRWINAAPEGIEWQEGAPLSAAVQTRRRSGTEYRAAVYPPRRFSFIRHTSFTGLTRHLGHGPARPDDDDGLQPALDPAELSVGSLLPLPDTDNAPRDIFHFPRGAAAGICLHEILEKHDFALPAGQQRENIAAILEKHGIETEWLDAVCLMADQTAAAPLHGGTTLSALPSARRKAEMGFVMHFDHLELGRLKNHLAAAGLPEACTAAAERLDFPTLQGFLNGFIDLTCLLPDGTACIIDYKSNHLGMDTGSYTQSALDQAVADHHYYLQAWIYALAAARHLKQRRQMPHTVRIRYLFLRGLDSGGRNGIWSWDIPTASLAEWL